MKLIEKSRTQAFKTILLKPTLTNNNHSYLYGHWPPIFLTNSLMFPPSVTYTVQILIMIEKSWFRTQTPCSYQFIEQWFLFAIKKKTIVLKGSKEYNEISFKTKLTRIKVWPLAVNSARASLSSLRHGILLSRWWRVPSHLLSTSTSTWP